MTSNNLHFLVSPQRFYGILKHLDDATSIKQELVLLTRDFCRSNKFKVEFLFHFFYLKIKTSHNDNLQFVWLICTESPNHNKKVSKDL